MPPRVVSNTSLAKEQYNPTPWTPETPLPDDENRKIYSTIRAAVYPHKITSHIPCLLPFGQRKPSFM